MLAGRTKGATGLELVDVHERFYMAATLWKGPAHPSSSNQL